MVNVTDGTDIHMWFRTYKFFFGHSLESQSFVANMSIKHSAYPSGDVREIKGCSAHKQIRVDRHCHEKNCPIGFTFWQSPQDFQLTRDRKSGLKIVYNTQQYPASIQEAGYKAHDGT
ncbi:MAG: hypothetical protein Fur0021_39240 [Candidatus Promineifilaceae bacterium]